MDEEISKSEKKRQAEALQRLGLALVALSLPDLQKLPLPANLYKAIIEAKSMKSHGAVRRQALFVGKLLRTTAHEAIIAAYEQLQTEAAGLSLHFHEVEAWRDRLLAEGTDNLTAFIQQYQPKEIQQLRHLIKKAKEEQSGDNKTAARALFRFLRELIT